MTCLELPNSIGLSKATAEEELSVPLDTRCSLQDVRLAISVPPNTGCSLPDVLLAISASIQSVSFETQLASMLTLNQQKKTSSFQAQVLDLSAGESCAKVRAVDPTTTVARLPEELSVLRQNLRNTIAPAVKRATDSTGNQYTVEVSDVVMPAGTLFIVGIVTRRAEA